MRYREKQFRGRKGLTLLEMVIAMAIITVVFSSVLPLFRNVQAGWDARRGSSETIQNGRVAMEHLNRGITKSTKITAVSNSSDTDGYIEFVDNTGATLRCDLAANNYIQFGPVGSQSELAGPVTSLKFTCYALDDMDTATTDVDSIRFVRVDAVFVNSAPNGTDKAFTTSAYLQTNGNNQVIGLLAWWKMDDTSGTTANDSSGNGNHGTLKNMSGNEWTGGIIDGALEFDGNNDYVKDADGEDYINGLTAFTISVWIQSDLIGTNRGIILGEVPSNDDVFSLRHDKLGLNGGGTNGIKAGFRISGIDQQIESSSNVQTTSWQHLAVTWSSGNQLALYIDGSIDSPRYNGPAQTGSTSDADALFIGRGPKSSADVWDGRIDDLRIYNRVLSAAEIAVLASRLKYSEFTEAKTASDTTSLTISTPGGAEEEDLLIAAVATDGQTSISLVPPGGQGWSEINLSNYSGEVTLGAWWKNADASEPATHQFTWTGDQSAYGWIMRFTGHDPSDPINDWATNGASSSTPTSAAVSPTVDYALVLRLGAFDDDDITEDSPGLSGHTAITMDKSGEDAGAGPIGWWKLDESSGTNAADSSGNGYNGTLTNMAGNEWTTGQIDGALDFTGGDYILDADGENYINGLTAFTVSVWIKSDVTNTDNGFLCGETPDGAGGPFAMRYDSAGWSGGGNDVIRCGVTISGTGQQLESSANVQTTSWQHLALTWSSGNQLALYIDGSPDTPTYNAAAQSGSVSGQDKLIIGRGTKDNNAGEGWNGKIDDFRIYNRVLSGAEIATLAAGGGGGGGGADSVSGGAGYLSQSSTGSSGTSTFSLTASQEARTITIAITPAPGEDEISP